MQSRWSAMLVVVGLVPALVAGCADDAGDDAPAAPSATATMRIEGIVQHVTPDVRFEPVVGANVTLRGHEQTQRTDALGHFAFEALVPSGYIVDIAAAGYLAQSRAVEPDNGTASLDVVLQPAGRVVLQEAYHFAGTLQCALEAVIISPSCDTVLTFAGQDPLFNDTSIFDFGANPDWKTVVVDVDFEPNAHPTLAGLRVTVQGSSDPTSQLLNYEQYGRFNASGPFSFRLEPNATYPDGVRPVPANATAFRLQVFPHSYGWHATCDVVCALGLAFGTDVLFDLYVTVFYTDPAPPGYSLLNEG